MHTSALARLELERTKGGPSSRALVSIEAGLGLTA